MKKMSTLTAIGVALAGLQVSAIAASDFSGSWVKDNVKSDPVPSALMLNQPAPARGGLRGGPGRGPAEVVITVQRDGNRLQVTDPQGVVSRYTLDGKPSTRPTDTGIEKATVAAKVQGDELVIETTQPYGGMPGNVTLHQKEVWSLSPDGKVLTIATTRSIPAVEKTYKEVYNRK